MSTEIERKFLITDDFKKFISEQYNIKQGFLSSVPERTVRIRITDNSAFITIKGKSTDDGLERFEWEKPINLDEAKQLLALCEPYIIDKTRYIVPIENNLKFEIDVFHGINQGLVIAEIELTHKNQDFKKPSWLGKDVTGEVKYYNSSLSKKPFTKW